MSDLLALSAGLALGAMFFGGLWWTTCRGAASTRPALWFFCSLLLRMGVALPGFYFVSGGHWQRLLMCLLGFLVARAAVARLTRSSRPGPAHVEPEVEHAP